MMRLPRLVALVLAAVACGPSPLGAEERMLPVPLGVIYPGDVIRDSMLGERAFGLGAGADGSVAETKSALIGKVARRTLLPDRPVPTIAVDAPKVVTINASVKIVFDEGGMVIVAYGSALQAGSIGDLIRVRNQDSGLVVTGRVQADGSIRVSEG
ncbi:flagellar basal body P-ring formation chaperone FlgA [Methylosinus sporium]|uniref:flagellar basal body P-ring formation chaperone FlgA n=1 Tax=Methylosinus sporium TaxID=428 RepID=UPI00383A1F1F